LGEEERKLRERYSKKNRRDASRGRKEEPIRTPLSKAGEEEKGQRVETVKGLEGPQTRT